MISVRMQEYGTCLWLVFSRNISVQLKEHGTCVWLVYSRTMLSICSCRNIKHAFDSLQQEHDLSTTKGTWNMRWIVFGRNMLKSAGPFIALVFSKTMLSILTGTLICLSAAGTRNMHLISLQQENDLSTTAGTCYMRLISFSRNMITVYECRNIEHAFE